MSRQLAYAEEPLHSLRSALRPSAVAMVLPVGGDDDPAHGRGSGPESWTTFLPRHKVQHVARPRQLIYRAGEPLEGVPVICEGWAVCVSRLSDGRRQILAFLLPGDLISTNAVFTDRLDFFVEAVTEVRYASCDRGELIKRLALEPATFDALIGAMLTEKKQAIELATDLGRRSASERIARLMLYLMARLDQRGLVQDNAFEIPLRQQHIADATGLTPVHVNRVLGSFRNDGFIEVSDGRLKIVRLAALQRIADIR